MSQICQGSSFLNFFLLFPLLLWCRFSAFFSAFPSVKNRMINKYPICCSNNAFFFQGMGESFAFIFFFRLSFFRFLSHFVSPTITGGRRKEERRRRVRKWRRRKKNERLLKFAHSFSLFSVKFYNVKTISEDFSGSKTSHTFFTTLEACYRQKKKDVKEQY